MAKQQIIPTPDEIRAAYIEQLSPRNPNAEEFVRFADEDMVDFIRRYDYKNIEISSNKYRAYGHI